MLRVVPGISRRKLPGGLGLTGGVLLAGRAGGAGGATGSGQRVREAHLAHLDHDGAGIHLRNGTGKVANAILGGALSPAAPRKCSPQAPPVH